MKIKTLILCISFCVLRGYSQDLLGAYIQTEKVPSSPTATSVIYDYNVILTLLTDPSLNNTRTTLTVDFGDATTGVLSISTSSVMNGTTVTTYTGTHTYAGSIAPPGAYNVVYFDSFRVSGIKNLPNSSMKQIFAAARIYADPYTYNRSSGKIENFPPHLEVEGDSVYYRPEFLSTQSDSVNYRLINCYGDGYYLPTCAVVDGQTGVIAIHKDSVGRYAFCLRINEWIKNNVGMQVGSRVTFSDFVIEFDETVGLANSDADKIEIYPNPSGGIFRINCNGIGHLTVVDLFGRSVLDENVICPGIFFIPKSGLFFVKLISNGHTKTAKLIVD